ncbi:MAG: 2-dehydro-3-deoxygalactonokinase [Acidobacteria bacterium]|nr:2-dehydro-3-deoxygalactonokinase [Acidobacteriota bacterium]
MAETELCAIYVDTGTTNSRVWLLHGDEILAKADAHIGVRDTAKDGSPARLRSTLRELIEKVRAEAAEAKPVCVAASGMITSSLGLAEVPHLVAPVGITELASAIQSHEFSDVTDLPVLLVPGVKSGQMPCDLATVAEADLMRGEETLCVGLAMMGLAETPATVLSLGSHWKAIRLDAQGRIAASVTSLSGELVYAAQTQTILASAVPHERLATVNFDWLEAGMRQQRRAGLARALFCVRLLEQSKQGSAEDRLSFLIGAFIAADLDALLRNEVLSDSVLLVGSGGLAAAWRHALAQVEIQSQVVTGEDSERALLAGLRNIISIALHH